LNPILKKIGFEGIPEIGDTVLPSEDFGPVSRFNSSGGEIIHKDQKMETAYRQIEWHWQEWRGRYDREEMSSIVDVPYKRYPRTFIPPPSEEFSIGKTSAGNYAVLASPTEFTNQTEKILVHKINLFLEIFGECEIFTESLDEMIPSPLRKLNWRVLPPGKRPWATLKQDINQVLSLVTDGSRPVIEHRFEVVNSYGSEFIAYGQAGFRGYVIFGFPHKDLYVCESIYFGNATYVFDDDWEELSKKTKAEILNENLQKARIIHREGWEKRIHDLLS